ncbi:MAG TPA: TetR family transcriptional regulator [Solirubrobacter sp.]|nr:TetR family transcriptional regulator [Solirubrobacter sp.]
MPRPRASLDTVALARAFAPDGLHGTPIDAVAAAAGVAKPTLYARGGDKEELFALAVEAEVERLLDRLDGDLIDLARALDAYVRDAPDGARLLLVTAPHAHSRVTGRVERSLRRITLALTAAVGGEDADVVAAALLGGARAALDGGPSVERLARLLPTGTVARPPDGIWTA